MGRPLLAVLVLVATVALAARDDAALAGFNLEEATTAGILASMAYCPFEELNDGSCHACKALGPNFEMLHVGYGRGDTLAFFGRFKSTTGGWRTNPGDMFLVFRGTVGLQRLNWSLNLAKRRVPSFFPGVPGRQHKGFLIGAWSSFFYMQNSNHTRDADIFKDFIRLAKQARRILVIGHSLGGAMAVNAQAFLFSHPEIDSEKVHLYTFGAPRVGDKTFAKYLDEKGKGRSWRIVHGHDPVPSVPPYLFGYRHSGQLVWFERATNWTRSTMHSESKRPFLSLMATADHSNYMGVHEDCSDNLWWHGKALDLGAHAGGETDEAKRYLVRPRVAADATPSYAAEEDEESESDPLLLTDEEGRELNEDTPEGEDEDEEEDDGSWIGKFLGFFRKLKEAMAPFNEIRRNLSSVQELWKQLLEENETYMEKWATFKSALKARLRRRRFSRHRT